MAIRWGLSVLDWQSHAINERAYHPVGVFKAECGHLLMMVTALSDRPNGKPCEDCAERQYNQAGRVRRAGFSPKSCSSQTRRPRSPTGIATGELTHLHPGLAPTGLESGIIWTDCHRGRTFAAFVSDD